MQSAAATASSDPAALSPTPETTTVSVQTTGAASISTSTDTVVTSSAGSSPAAGTDTALVLAGAATPDATTSTTSANLGSDVAVYGSDPAPILAPAPASVAAAGTSRGGIEPATTTTSDSITPPPTDGATTLTSTVLAPLGAAAVPGSGRGPPPGSVLINAADGGSVTSGEATLTFAPGSLPSDAYLSIAPETVSVPGLGSEVAYALQAIDVSSGAKIETFNSPPVLSVVGSVPGSRIYYLDPVNGLQPISSSYNPATGAVTAGLPHFSTYLAGVSGILSTISGYLAQYASGAISQSQTFNVGSQSIGGVVEIDGVSLAFSGITFSGTSPNFTYSGTVTITAGGGSIAASPFTASFGSATGTYSLTNQAATAGTLTITVNAPSIAIASFVAISAAAIKVVSSDDGTTSEINLGATGVTASLSAGAGGPSLSVNAANLGFVVRHGDSGSSAPTFALKGTGSVSLTGLSQDALTGPAWEVAYDSMGDLSGNNAITVDAGSGTTVTVDLSQPTGVNGAWSSFANTPASLAQLTVGGQNLSGVFAVSESASQLTAAASDVGLQIGPAASPYVSIPNSASTPSGTGASGELIIAANGLAGDLTVPSIAINVPTLALASATGQIEINTQPAPVSQTFMVGGSSSTLALPAGPFVGVNVDVTNVTVGSGNASGQITGSLSFQQQTANGVTTSIVGISNATVAIGGSNVLTNGQGVLVVESTGVAGYLSGTASIAAGGVSAGGQVALRINTTGGAVNATVTVGGQTLTINYGAGEGNVFSVSIDGLSVNIAGIATLEGNVNLQSFTTTTTDGAIAGTAFAGSGMTVFVGNGPALLADGSPNPLAEGLEISGATVALFESGGNIAFVATGSVQLVGVPGATLGGQIIGPRQQLQARLHRDSAAPRRRKRPARLRARGDRQRDDGVLVHRRDRADARGRRPDADDGRDPDLAEHRTDDRPDQHLVLACQRVGVGELARPSDCPAHPGIRLPDAHQRRPVRHRQRHGRRQRSRRHLCRNTLALRQHHGHRAHGRTVRIDDRPPSRALPRADRLERHRHDRRPVTVRIVLAAGRRRGRRRRHADHRIRGVADPGIRGHTNPRPDRRPRIAHRLERRHRGQRVGQRHHERSQQLLLAEHRRDRVQYDGRDSRQRRGRRRRAHRRSRSR